MPNDSDDLFSGGTLQPDGEVLLAGRYRVIRQLGSGGMGTVYLARDEKLDGLEVAIKTPPAILAGNPKAMEQLKQEARRGMKLSHSNIVSLRNFEVTDEGVFLVMDYVPGRTLEDLLLERETLSENEVLRLFTPLAEALDYAHREKVIHRDVKPSNVLIREDGKPFLADFGIAREMEETLTRITGRSSSGTLTYMSPQQLHGEDPCPSQDLYSLAATMYECLAGRPPFHRGGIARQIEMDRPAPPIPRETALTRSILAGLEKDPAERPRSCSQLVRAEKGRPGRGRRSKRRLNAVILGVLVLQVVAVAVWALNRYQAETPADRTIAGETPEPPTFRGTLLVSFPADSRSVTRDGSLTVSGSAEGMTGGRVAVNGQKCEPDPSGRFEVLVFLDEGENEIRVGAMDGSGGQAEEQVFTVVRDVTPPEFALSSPADGLLTREDRVLIQGRATDEHGLAAVAVGEEGLTWKSDGSFTKEWGLAEGVNAIRVEAVDEAGNRTVETLSVVRDSTPPVLTVVDPAEGQFTNEGSVEVAGRVVDSRFRGLTVQNDPVAVGPSGEFRVSVPVSEGDNLIRLLAADEAGNESVEERRVCRDSAPPTIRCDPVPTVTGKSPLIVTGEVSETGCRVEIGGVPAKMTGLQFRGSASLREDWNILELQVWDQAGNRATETLQVQMDTRPPSLRIDAPDQGDITVEAEIEVRGLVADKNPVTLMVCGKKVLPAGDGSFARRVSLRLGENVIEVTATDAAGNASRQQIRLTRGTEPETPISKIDGKVMATNNALNIVLLSVGRRHGVKVGDKFTIHRRGDYVGQVVVEKVEKDHCSGYSKKDLERFSVQVGDLASTRF